jgi:transcriptional regulator with XRE-family HTH domain
MLTAVDNCAELLRAGRRELGISTRALGVLAGVAYPTISRIENGHCVPRRETLDKISRVLGLSLQSGREAPEIPRLCDLVDRWEYDAFGVAQPEWTYWRAFTDQLALHPDLTAAAVGPPPSPSGSLFIDNLLAGIAEILVDQSGLPRPSWTRRYLPLNIPWRAPGTPLMHADHVAATPPQLAARNIVLPVSALWRSHQLIETWEERDPSMGT